MTTVHRVLLCCSAFLYSLNIFYKITVRSRLGNALTDLGTVIIDVYFSTPQGVFFFTVEDTEAKQSLVFSLYNYPPSCLTNS